MKREDELFKQPLEHNFRKFQKDIDLEEKKMRSDKCACDFLWGALRLLRISFIFLGLTFKIHYARLDQCMELVIHITEANAF